jgi:hypothetical protein
LIAPHIYAPFSLFAFHPSTSLRSDLLPIPVELTGDPENRLEYFGELIAHVVGKTLQGYQSMNMIRKGQIQGVVKGDITGQVTFIAGLFGVAA